MLKSTTFSDLSLENHSLSDKIESDSNTGRSFIAVKVQWHPGFYAGIGLEFKQFPVSNERENKLTHAPLSIDLLIIRKTTTDLIDNDLGNIFRQHNIREMKSPDDDFSIDVRYKVQAYACLYKSSGEEADSIKAHEVTISLYRDNFPRKLISLLKEAGSTIEQKFPGIYYVTGNTLFPTQIIVSSRLEPELHSSLRVLSRNVRAQDIRRFALQAKIYRPGRSLGH